MLFYDYKFQSETYQNIWISIVSHRFESMELYYRKQLSMQRLLSYFRRAFKIAPITLKTSTKDADYKYKLLALYLLTKYSHETFEVISEAFNISVETLQLISANDTYNSTFEDEIKLFFKQFEEDFLLDRKSALAFSESVELVLPYEANLKEDII